MKKIAFKRYHIVCAKCGYEWMATDEKPKRCASCNNPNPSEPRKKLHEYEKIHNEVMS